MKLLYFSYSKRRLAIISLGCIFSVYSMQAMHKKGPEQKVDVSGIINGLSLGFSDALKDVSMLASSAFLAGFHSVTNNYKNDKFDLKDRHLLLSLSGGVVGSIIKKSMNVGSYNRIYNWAKTAIDHPFAATWLAYNLIFNLHSVKNDPLPSLVAGGYLALNWANHWNGA